MEGDFLENSGALPSTAALYIGNIFFFTITLTALVNIVMQFHDALADKIHIHAEC